MKTRHLVPMAFVADVERSIDFYGKLGFEVGNTFTPEQEKNLPGRGSSLMKHN